MTNDDDPFEVVDDYLDWKPNPEVVERVRIRLRVELTRRISQKHPGTRIAEVTVRLGDDSPDEAVLFVEYLPWALGRPIYRELFYTYKNDEDGLVNHLTEMILN